MGDYSKTFARKEAQAKAEVTALLARAQQGDQAAIAELDRGARIADNHIPGTSRSAVNVYRQALRDLGDPTQRGVGLKDMARTASPLKAVGGAVKKLAPLTVFIPGVGPVLAGAIGAAGSLASGDSLGKAVVSGVTDYAGAKVLSGAKAALAARGAAGAVPAAASGGGGGIGALAGKALDYAKTHPAQIAAGLGAINSAGQQAKGSNAVDRAAGIATADYNQTAPLRARAVQMLNQPLPQARDLSYLNDPANPFARRPPVAPVAPVAPVPPGGARPISPY